MVLNQQAPEFLPEENRFMLAFTAKCQKSTWQAGWMLSQVGNSTNLPS